MGLFEVDTMRCRAQGSAYSAIDIQWTCTAETGPYFKLGNTEVLCEGYDHADDPYILKGSCGVEYRLILTEEGESKFGHQRPLRIRERIGLPAYLFWHIFIFVVYKIIQRGIEQWLQNRREARRALQGATQGSNDDSGDDPPPPPPYDEDDYGDSPFIPQAPKASWKSQSFTQESNRGASQAIPSSSRSNFQFGTAAMAGATGAAIGVAASQAYRSSARSRQAAGNRSQDNSRSTTTRTWDSGNSHDSSSPSQESTGFGGTTRR